MADVLFDTARGEVVPFEPGHEVKMYVCGITPYDSTHLGHANTYLTYDLLIRRLEDLGHEVKLVRNITDVDDSILPKARELGVDFELAAEETARFHGDMIALNTRPVFAEPHATKWVAEMVELVETLEAKGHTYVVDGTVFFDVSTFDLFGDVGLRRIDHGRVRSVNEAGAPTILASATRSTSSSGNHHSTMSRHGPHRGAQDDPAGTSSARRCRRARSAPPSISTVEAPI